MALARIQVPKEAKQGELMTIRIAIQHPMETGFRYDHMGRPIPKNVVNTLICRYNGVEVFRAEMGSGISANPYLQFYTRAVASGELVLEWVDDAGERGRACGDQRDCVKAAEAARRAAIRITTAGARSNAAEETFVMTSASAADNVGAHSRGRVGARLREPPHGRLVRAHAQPASGFHGDGPRRVSPRRGRRRRHRRGDGAHRAGLLGRAVGLSRRAQGAGGRGLRPRRAVEAAFRARDDGWDLVLAARFMDRVGKGIRGAPRDALIADLTPPEIRGAAVRRCASRSIPSVRFSGRCWRSRSCLCSPATSTRCSGSAVIPGRAVGRASRGRHARSERAVRCAEAGEPAAAVACRGRSLRRTGGSCSRAASSRWRASAKRSCCCAPSSRACPMPMRRSCSCVHERRFRV